MKKERTQLFSGGEWIVLTDGSMVYKKTNKIERDITYPKRMLSDPNFPSYFLAVKHFDWNNFIPAYAHALSISGFKNVTINTSPSMYE